MTANTTTDQPVDLGDLPPFATSSGERGYDQATGEFTAAGAAELAGALRILVGASWVMAEQKGFHEDKRGFPEKIALMHSELSEALESHRNNEPNIWYRDKDEPGQHEEPVGKGGYRKAEGIGAELADVIIRIGDAVGDDTNLMDAFIDAVINKNKYNATRPYKHGKTC